MFLQYVIARMVAGAFICSVMGGCQGIVTHLLVRVLRVVSKMLQCGCYRM